MNDLRFALRQLAKSPGFVIVAVLTLALGIGANTAIFSVVNALLLQPLPYSEPDRLVQVAEIRNGGGFAGSDGGVFSDWETQTTQLESIAAAHSIDKNLTGEGDPVRVSGTEVSADFLRVLRLNPILGRGFTREEDAPGGNRHVIILTHELWQSRYHGDPAIIDRTVQLDAENYTVIGVLPPHALVNSTATFLTPATIRADAYKLVRNYNYVCNVIGRLKPGATAEQATAELVAAREGVLSQYPPFRKNWTVGVRSLHESIYGNTRPFALTLLAAVGAVLLIACANVANLLLAKASARQGEIAVRVALGATTGRIVRQLMSESLLLAGAGGLVGILVGAWAIDPLIRFTSLGNVPGLAVHIDVTVLLFTLAATACTGVLFGLFPAFTLARPNLSDCMKEGARGSTGGRRRLQSLLIVSETALTVVLLVCAGLLLRSFFRALNSDAGFNRDNVLVFSLAQPASKAPTIEHRTRFIRDILRSLGQVPGVASAGEASTTPMNGLRGYGEFVSREDRPATRSDYNAGFDGVDGDFFQTFGIPLLRGRFFTEADNEDKAPKVMIVNDTLARRLFPNEDPLGRLLNFKNATWEIVGVVGSVRQYQLDVDPRGQIYMPSIRFPWSTMFAVRTHVPPLTLADDMRRAVQAVDPQQPIANLATLTDMVERSLQGRRTMLTLLLIFAGTALLLACVGIYGVMAYSVAQRTREMGIRLALGAGTRRVVSLVVRDGLKLVLLGVAVGALASYGAGKLLAAQLYATSGSDPIVFTLVAGLLLCVALLACWLPARRATRVDPMTALRAE
jgi:putative ABC transport system permease protein